MKHWKEFALGLFILGAVLLLAYMSITIGKVQFGDTLEVEALFDNASGVVKDAPVMMAGIEIGHVQSMQVTKGKALMKMVLQPNIEVHQDARAEIRSKSLLGEKYIALIPGSNGAPKLQDGERIADTMTPVDLDEVLNHLAPVLTNLNPQDLNTLVHSIAVALDGKGQDLRDLLTGSAVLMKAVSNDPAALERIVKNLDGATARANHLLTHNGPAIDRIVANLNTTSQDAPQLVQNISAITEDVRGITGPFKEQAPDLAQKLNRVATEADKLTHSLGQHPDLVPNLNSTLAELPPLLRKAPATLDRLPAVLDQLSPVLKGGNTLIGKLNPVLDKANNLLDEEKIRKVLQEEGVLIHVDKGIQVRLW